LALIFSLNWEGPQKFPNFKTFSKRKITFLGVLFGPFSFFWKRLGAQIGFGGGKGGPLGSFLTLGVHSFFGSKELCGLIWAKPGGVWGPFNFPGCCFQKVFLETIFFGGVFHFGGNLCVNNKGGSFCKRFLRECGRVPTHMGGCEEKALEGKKHLLLQRPEEEGPFFCETER